MATKIGIFFTFAKDENIFKDTSVWQTVQKVRFALFYIYSITLNFQCGDVWNVDPNYIDND